MSLTVGTRLGPYEILSPLGAGGMGEAYRARDTRLRRDVAIKILAGHLADRPELRERFEREARAIASLNHPHICTVHDVGHQDGTDYFVMELLDGETLAQRLRGGALPLSQVLQYGAEIGDALDKAHRKGVTHRDLKPGNIMLTKSGAKLLDFGLAKLGGSATEHPGEQETRDGPITAEGTLLGTMNYMAPEQLEGREADARSDIFAFGAVLYELATGKKAFEGKSQASLIAAIMSSEPPTLSAIQPMTPPALDRIIRKCLRKDPDDRWQSAHDVTDELKWLVESGSQTATVPLPIPTRPATGRRLVRAGAAVLMLAALAAAGARYTRPSATPTTAAAIRFTVGPPDKGSFPVPNTNFQFLSVSPDGTKLAFQATDAAGKFQLWIRGLDATSANPIPGTEGSGPPSWSPDSRFLAFVADGKLKKVSASGGPAQTVAEAAAGCCAWSPKGVILFNPALPGPIFQVSDAGVAATPATALDTAATEVTHTFPYFLPDGEHFLYLSRGASLARSAIYAGSLGSKERVRVLGDASNVAYVPPGYLLFHRNGTLMAQPFDAARLATTGDAIPIAERVQFNAQNRAASFAASATGVLAYRSAVSASPRALAWVSRNGTEQLVSVPPRGYQTARISPDGRRMAVEIADQQGNQIWVYDIGRETLTRLTFQGSDNELAIWSPDGKRLTYYSNQAGPLNLFWQMADGSGGPERLTTSPSAHAAMSWSSDGRLLAFTDNPVGNRDIWVLDTQDGKPKPFLKTTFNEGGAQFSPDGRWMAYVSDESGRGEIYVQPYPGPGGKWQVSTDGGLEPRWNRNGRELFYRDGDKMIAVPVSTENGFSAGRPQMLFERRYVSTPLPQTAGVGDVSADGQRFLMIKEAEQESTPISVVVNWLAQLDSRTPRTAP